VVAAAASGPFADHLDAHNGWAWSAALECVQLDDNPGAGSAEWAAVDEKLRKRIIPMTFLPHTRTTAAAAAAAATTSTGNASGSETAPPSSAVAAVAMPTTTMLFPNKSKPKTSKWLADLPPSVLSRANKFRKFPGSVQ
jgi:hypothetical protein